MNETITKVIIQEALAISKIPVTDEYNKALEIIHQRVHKKKWKINSKWNG